MKRGDRNNSPMVSLNLIETTGTRLSIESENRSPSTT